MSRDCARIDTGHAWTWRLPEFARLLVVLLVSALALLAAAGAATAQICQRDADCQRVGGSGRCVGDTLVVTRSNCVAGRCVEREVQRQSCRAPLAGRCTGGATFVRTVGRCDPLAARCISRTESDVCARTCSCRNRRLAISTGQCMSNLGCNRVVLVCEHGCTCTGEPRCLQPGEAN